MCSTVFGQGVILRHRIEVDALRCGVVPSVARLDDAALLEKRQGYGDLRERQGLALDQRLERDGLVARFVDGVGHLLEGLPRAAVLVGSAAARHDLRNSVVSTCCSVTIHWKQRWGA